MGQRFLMRSSEERKNFLQKVNDLAEIGISVSCIKTLLAQKNKIPTQNAWRKYLGLKTCNPALAEVLDNYFKSHYNEDGGKISKCNQNESTNHSMEPNSTS